MKEKIEKIIIQTLQELNDELERSELENPTSKTKLFSRDGALDSLALVTFLADLEDRLSEEFDTEITLANAQAMSQRFSPFKNVESLSLYIQGLLDG